MNKIQVPVWEKTNLTVEEAAEYSNIGVNRITGYLKQPGCPFCLSVGTKRLVKRKQFDEFLSSASQF